MSLIERAVARSRGDPAPRGPLPRPRLGGAPGAVADAARPAPQPPEIPPERHVALDLTRLAKAGHLVPGNLRSPFAQEMNAIKRSLRWAMEERRRSCWDRPLVLMVTSTRPDEGKSFLSLNLALSFLFVDARRVVLVDADTAQGTLSRQLGGRGHPGVSEVLRHGERRPDEQLLAVGQHGLELLPAGTLSTTGGDSTRQDCQRLVLALRRLAAGDAVVVIDTPPMTAFPTAHLLADYVDHLLFVVGAGRTRPDDIALALAQLSDHHAASFVLNRMIAAPNTAEYSYGTRA